MPSSLTTWPIISFLILHSIILIILEMSRPFLYHHIVDVVLSGADEKMIWPDTRWVVTLVTYEMFVWDLSKMNNPRDSMRIATFAWTYSESSISLFILTGSPQPAFFCFLYFSPKSSYPFFGENNRSVFFIILVFAIAHKNSLLRALCHGGTK